MANDSAENGYRLAVTSVPDDRNSCVQVLHEVLGWTTIDARQRFRHVPSIWPDVLPRDIAERAVAQLCSLKAEATLVEASRVPDIRLPRTLHHVRCAETGLEIISTTGDLEETIAWTDLSTLSVASVGGLNSKIDQPLADGVFRHATGIAQYDDVPRKYGLELWLIAENPTRASRVDALEMNYEYLQERLSNSTDENFSALLGDLQKFAPDLAMTSTTQHFVKGDSRLLYQLPSSQIHGEQALATWAVHQRS